MISEIRLRNTYLGVHRSYNTLKKSVLYPAPLLSAASSHGKDKPKTANIWLLSIEPAAYSNLVAASCPDQKDKLRLSPYAKAASIEEEVA